MTASPAPDPAWLHQQLSTIWARQRNSEGKNAHGHNRNRRLDAEAVIEAAREASHPLHNQFDWSTSSAELLKQADRLLWIARDNAYRSR